MAARETKPQGAKPDKLWTDAIRIAALEAFEGGDVKKLRKAAEKLVELALNGDIAALKEMGDRLEGKPTQRVEATGEGGGPIQTEEVGLKELARRLAFVIARGAESGEP